MAVAILLEWSGLTQEQYDEAMKLMQLDVDPPVGGLFHVAGPISGGGWRVVDVWESAEAFQKFSEERIVPAVRKVGITTQPRVEVYPAHNIYIPATSSIASLGASSLPL
jgi:hypothetical protein